MFSLRNFSKIITKPLFGNTNVVSSKFCAQTDNLNKSEVSGDLKSKYDVFKDDDSEIILDIYEDRLKSSEPVEEDEDPFQDLNLQRGQTGVFDIEDLVTLLKRENAQKIFVASLPDNVKYVDYICVVCGKSHKHMQALAQFTRKVYKKKMWETDSVPRLEGKNSHDWLAIDLGNIALHIFSQQARKVYDLDSLWAVGPQFDMEYNKQDPVADMLERHSIYLNDLQPAS